jgi:hypothetical protein
MLAQFIEWAGKNEMRESIDRVLQHGSKDVLLRMVTDEGPNRLAELESSYIVGTLTTEVAHYLEALREAGSQAPIDELNLWGEEVCQGILYVSGYSGVSLGELRLRELEAEMA